MSSVKHIRNIPLNDCKTIQLIRNRRYIYIHIKMLCYVTLIRRTSLITHQNDIKWIYIFFTFIKEKIFWPYFMFCDLYGRKTSYTLWYNILLFNTFHFDFSFSFISIYFMFITVFKMFFFLFNQGLCGNSL